APPPPPHPHSFPTRRSSDLINAHAFGSGPVIERGTILHPQVSELLIEAAEAEEIPHTLMASARATGTDADVIHFSRNGIVTGGRSEEHTSELQSRSDTVCRL